MIKTYLQSSCRITGRPRLEFPVDPSKPCQFLSAEVLREDGSPGSEFSCDEPIKVRLELEVRRPVPEPA